MSVYESPSTHTFHRCTFFARQRRPLVAHGTSIPLPMSAAFAAPNRESTICLMDQARKRAVKAKFRAGITITLERTKGRLESTKRTHHLGQTRTSTMLHYLLAGHCVCDVVLLISQHFPQKIGRIVQSAVRPLWLANKNL